MLVRSMRKNSLIFTILLAAAWGMLIPAACASLPEEQVTAVYDATLEVQGDYNRDGIVNAADYTLWRDTLGQSGDRLVADGNGNRTVDPEDHSLWQARFGEAAPSDEEESGAKAIPEPAAAALALMFLIVAGMWRWFDFRASGNQSS